MSNFLLFPVIVSSEVGYTVRGHGPPSLPLSRGREGARRTVWPRRSSLFWSPLAPTSFSRSRGGPLRPDLTQVSCLCWYIFSLFFSLKFVIVNVVFVPLFQCTADCAAGSPMPLRRTAMPLNGRVSWAVFWSSSSSSSSSFSFLLLFTFMLHLHRACALLFKDVTKYITHCDTF